MKKEGTIVEINGKNATVLISDGCSSSESGCAGCSACSGCDRIIRIEAENKINADLFDKVVVYTSSKKQSRCHYQLFFASFFLLEHVIKKTAFLLIVSFFVSIIYFLVCTYVFKKTGYAASEIVEKIEK